MDERPEFWTPPEGSPPPARPASLTITWAQLVGTIVGCVALGGIVVSLALLWVLGAGPFASDGRVASFGPRGSTQTLANGISPLPTLVLQSPVVPATVETGSGADPFSVVVTIAARVTPAVVTITSTQGSSGFGGGDTSVGSGVIVDARGWILTNDHVIAGASQLSVQLADGRTFDGTVVADDPALDLAVVKVAASGLPTAPIGRSAGLRVGQLVVAIGSPEGIYPDSVASGILSAIGRSIDVGTRRQPQTLSNLLQTDAPINPGNSGGPLLDAAGTIIGINTATDPNAQGIGFAIPIDAAGPIIDQALAGGN